jgi:hypothetical protein
MIVASALVDPAAISSQKRRTRPHLPMARARITLAPPPSVQPFPAWARVHSTPKTPEEAGFLAGRRTRRAASDRLPRSPALLTIETML